MKRAKTYEEIKPLIALCKLGKLFDVQAWIAAGKSVNPPLPPEKGPRPRSPLEYAIDAGFHSLVQVLLDGGAEIEQTDRYSSLNHALGDRQYEVAKLLVEHGADVKSVDMYTLFHTWEATIITYFIDRGADVETNNPLAQAFCSRIWAALRVFKQYQGRFPSFSEQANIALRHHCKEGNLKWVSLMLWVGADPFAKGPDQPDSEPDPEYDHNALELAAICGRFEVFRLRQIKLNPGQERAHKLVQMTCYGKKSNLLKHLLEIGYPVNDQINGGSSHIEVVLNSMSWWRPHDRKKVDTEETREKMKLLYLLIRHGARWIPTNPKDMNSVRRSLLGLDPDYTIELIWLLTKYGACDRSVVEHLLKSSAMRAHVAMEWQKINELVARIPTKAG